jgi:glycosyltransferase involved in cell wall biosynthesis
MPDEQTDASRALPGLGNERLPIPYCRPDMLAHTHVEVLADGQLPECAGIDIAILQGNPSARYGAAFTSWLAMWQAGGGRIVYDLPEDPDMDPDVDGILVAAANVVTVSDETIAGRITEDRPDLADKVMVIPTYPDENLWQIFRTRHRNNETLQIGYFGSEANLADLERIKPALEAIQARHGVEVKVVGCYEGSPPVVGAKVSYLKRRSQPGFRQSDFIGWLKQVATWDIILVPDSVGVGLKFLRSTTLGGAIVCRRDPAVSDFARHEENCLLVEDDVAAWEDALEQLLTDASLRQRLRRNARQGAMFSWSQQSQSRIYDQVLDRAGNDLEHTA